MTAVTCPVGSPLDGYKVDGPYPWLGTEALLPPPGPVPVGGFWYWFVIPTGDDPLTTVCGFAGGLGHTGRAPTGTQSVPVDGTVPAGDLYLISQDGTTLPPLPTSGMGAPPTPEPAMPSDPNPPATQPDTTVAGGGALGGVGATGDTDSHSHDPRTTSPDTTQGGGGIGGTASPTYRAPLDNPPAAVRDTTTQGSAVQVASGSPDAAAVGGGTAVNPNAAEPTDAGSVVQATSTKDTTSYGSPPITTVPAAGTSLAPTGVTAVLVANRNAVTVSWTKPTNAVAANVLGYTIENNTGGTTSVGKDATSVEFDQGLVPGGTYTFTVYARTANGTGPRSAASAPITLPSIRNLAADATTAEGLSGPSDRVPGAPTIGAATQASATSVSVVFTPPASNGGSPVTEYTVTSTPGGKTKVGAGSPLVVTGLTTGTAYTFKAKAKNAYGYGAESAASNSVTPA